MSFSVSVVICTHNPRPDYFGRVLAALRQQTLAMSQWELLVIDNQSAEPLAGRVDLTWHPAARVIREETLGLTPARLRGIQEAAGKLLVFVDDDNVLAADYLDTVVQLFADHPRLGCLGASIAPEYEETPSKQVASLVCMLAVRKVKAELWSNNVNDGSAIPWGAGLCLRADVGRAYPSLIQELDLTHVLDRRGTRLTCGGDDLFSYCAAAMNFGFGVFPQLSVTHLIPKRRLDYEYFIALTESHRLSHALLNFRLRGIRPRHKGLLRHGVGALRSILRGVFSLRLYLATQRGERHAQRLIEDNRLRPLSRPWAEVVRLAKREK